MVALTVNGTTHEADRPARSLLSWLRFDLGLTGTKYGCGEGLCGACTVLVDGQPLRACLSTVGGGAGGGIRRIEGLAEGGTRPPVRGGFVAEQGMQCGCCTPGFIMSSVGLLSREPHPSSEQIREALAEHVCRCGTYVRIQRAVERAGQRADGPTSEGGAG